MALGGPFPEDFSPRNGHFLSCTVEAPFPYATPFFFPEPKVGLRVGKKVQSNMCDIPDPDPPTSGVNSLSKLFLFVFTDGRAPAAERE